MFSYHFGVFQAYVFQGCHSSGVDPEWQIRGTSRISRQKLLDVLDAGWMSHIPKGFQSQGNFLCARLAQCLSCKAMKMLKNESKSVEFNSSSYLYSIRQPVLGFDFRNFSLFNSFILNIFKFFFPFMNRTFYSWNKYSQESCNKQLLPHSTLKLSSKILKEKITARS